MNKFLAKYGKASIFTLIVILCMSFLIHLFSVSSGYLQSIDRQALDRAENYAGEQAVQLQEQFGALKMRAMAGKFSTYNFRIASAPRSS